VIVHLDYFLFFIYTALPAIPAIHICLSSTSPSFFVKQIKMNIRRLFLSLSIIKCLYLLSNVIHVE
jgi:hypothetical protein